MARLRRVSDGKGDCGARSECIAWKKDGTIKKIMGRKPKLGCSILVGSITARTYSDQDYWLTTVVTEIIEDKGDYVKFKTGNSVYEWTE